MLCTRIIKIKLDCISDNHHIFNWHEIPLKIKKWTAMYYIMHVNYTLRSQKQQPDCSVAIGLLITKIVSCVLWLTTEIAISYLILVICFQSIFASMCLIHWL